MSQESKQAEWSGRMADFAASGLSQKKWCEQNGVALHNFSYWRQKLNSIAADAAWCPVRVTPEPGTSVSATGGLTVTVGAAHILVQPDFDADLLRAVVQALAGADGGVRGGAC